MEGALHPMSTPHTTLRDRAAAGLLLLLLVIGSLALWIGIPVATLWALSKLTESSTHHFVFGLIGVPLAMALFAPFLLWVNALYVRVTGEYTSEEDEDHQPQGHRCGAHSATRRRHRPTIGPIAARSCREPRLAKRVSLSSSATGAATGYGRK